VSSSGLDAMSAAVLASAAAWVTVNGIERYREAPAATTASRTLP
jgi:hypothetical protein